VHLSSLTVGKKTPNIIVFGESGTGKSSVVNMFDGEEKAEVSRSAVGASFQFQRYERTIYDEKFNVFEIMALDEQSTGIDKTSDAVVNLSKLVSLLEDGVNLLVYVKRGRITESALKNYRMFYENFCQSQVPIVLVVTGMESEAQPEAWWERNGQFFENHGMKFNGKACVTAFEGKKKSGVCIYQKEYDDSKWQVNDLVKNYRIQLPWSLPGKPWFERVFLGFIKFGYANGSRQNLCDALVSTGMERKQALELVKKSVKQIKEEKGKGIPDRSWNRLWK
jgi:predicted GTPase